MAAPWDRRAPAEQAHVQRHLLSSWLPQAVGFAPYWAGRAAEMGRDASRLDDRDDLARFAPVRQAHIAHAGGAGAPALLMRPTESQIKALADRSALRRIADGIRGGGTAGHRRALLEEYKPIHLHRAGVLDELAIAYSRSDLDRLHRAGARAAQVLGLDDADYLVNAVPAGPRLDWWGIYHLALGASILVLHPRGHGDDLETCLASFRLLPVTAVAVLRDEAVELAAAAVEADVDVARVHTVVTVGPPPDEDWRSEITEAWRAAGAIADVRVRAAWAPAEARALWVECREGGTGLHTLPDLEVLEVVDAVTGGPADGDGDLTYTSAGWHGSALLRYRTGAWVDALATDHCPACGRTVPRLDGEIVPEAWQPALRRGEYEVRLDLRGVAAAVGTTPGVRTWRVEIRPPATTEGDDVLAVEVAGDLGEAGARDLATSVEQETGVRVDEVELAADAAQVNARASELGSVFADLR